MILRSGCFALFLISFSPLYSQQLTTAEDLKKLGDAFLQDFKDFRNKSREARNTGGAQPPVPDATDAVNKMLQFAKTNPDDPETLEAATWIMRWGRYAKSRPDVSAIYGILIEHHLNDVNIGKTCVGGIYDYHPKANELLQKVRGNLSNPKAAGAAAWVLAKRARKDEEKIEHLKFAVANLGDFTTGENTVLLGVAEKDLANAQKFAIGQIAPEIVGKDTEEIEFKLSDYRGKVVVLDFWGHW